jgi:hypothetical protein
LCTVVIFPKHGIKSTLFMQGHDGATAIVILPHQNRDKESSPGKLHVLGITLRKHYTDFVLNA